MRQAIACIVTCLLAAAAQASLAPGKPTVLVTGANRGIGLEYVREMAGRGWNVIAAVRDPASATELADIAARERQVVIEKLDVSDQASVDGLASRYKGQSIDILVLNAAITPKYASAFKPLSGMDPDMARRSFEVNALGPVRMIRALIDNVAGSQQKKIVVLSSKAGSFAEGPKMPMMYEYRGSKAALNMYMHTLSFETPKKGVILTLLSPGQVNTMPGMKIPNAIEPAESVEKMLKVIDGLTPADNGKFLNYEDRREVGW
jgi:NAD(P)-dependent dehydrogenase (short-subunit alcohol dehydrogenase family)